MFHPVQDALERGPVDLAVGRFLSRPESGISEQAAGERRRDAGDQSLGPDPHYDERPAIGQEPEQAGVVGAAPGRGRRS